MRIRSSENTAPFRDAESYRSDPVRGSIPIVGAEPARPPDNLVVGVFESDDAFARAARSLRMSIAAGSARDGLPIRSVALVGIDAGDESSALAAGLAESYARAGAATVLVDADYVGARRRAMADIPNSPAEGLIDVLAGAVDARSAVAATSTDGLAMLSLGTLNADTLIPSSGERFHRRVKPLLESYSMMVVDAGTSDEDPPALCEALDAIVLVVRRNRTTIAQAQHYIGRLDDMKVRIVGTLIIE